MKITKKIWQTGTGIVISIDKNVMKKLGLKIGDFVECEITPVKIRKKVLGNIIGNYMEKRKLKKLEITKNE